MTSSLAHESPTRMWLSLWVFLAACVAVDGLDEERLARARLASARGDWVRAGTLWQDLHQHSRGRDPRTAEGLAQALHQQGLSSRARPILTAAVERFPERASLWALAAEVWLANGEPERGLEALRRALRLDPSRADWAGRLGELEAARGRPCAALPLLGQAVGRPEAASSLWLGLARAARDCGDPVGALHAYRAAFQRGAEPIQALLEALELGLSELEIGASQPLPWLSAELEAWASRACEVNPQSVAAHRFAARLARLRGDWRRADQALARAAELDPADLETLIEWIEVRVAAGRIPAAERVADFASALEPTEVERARIERALGSSVGPDD